jgi:hypothetical protein
VSGRDLTRAYDIKRLFDKQLDKVDQKLDHPERMQAAAKLMDKLVGEDWRGEVQLPGITVIEVQTVGANPKPSREPESFYNKVHKAMYEEGMDYKDEGGLDEHEASEAREQCDPKKKLIEEFTALVDKYFK